MPLSIFDCEGQCIDTRVLPVRFSCRCLSSIELIVFQTLLVVVGVVMYCGTLLFLAPSPVLSGFSVGARQLGSSVFHLNDMMVVLVFCAHLGVS